MRVWIYCGSTAWPDRQRSVKLPSGRQRAHDGARSLKDHEFREYKNAEVAGGKFVMEQISKEREHLQTDPKAKGVWVVVQGSPTRRPDESSRSLNGTSKIGSSW